MKEFVFNNCSSMMIGNKYAYIDENKVCPNRQAK